MHHRAGWLDPVFVFLSWIGSQGLVWIAIAVVVAVVRRRALIFVEVAVAAALAEVISFALRQAIDRNRPPLDYPRPGPLVHVPHSGSVPSGHTTTAFACATILAFFVPRPRYSIPLFVLAALIGFSRIYVGVHYPLDVLAGAALGVAIATALRWLVTSRPRLRPTLRAS